MSIFRNLNKEEIKEFKQWARDNHKAGDHFDENLWHPVVIAECKQIDSERNLAYK